MLREVEEPDHTKREMNPIHRFVVTGFAIGTEISTEENMLRELAITLVMAAAVSRADDAAASLEMFKAAGPNAEVTVFPGRMMGQPRPGLGELVAVMLKRAGMQKLELSTLPFRRTGDPSMEQLAMEFGEFVRRNPIHTK